MPKKRQYFVGILLAVTILIAMGPIIDQRTHQEPALSTQDHAAFLKTQWGMSQLEVEQSNGRPLHQVVSYRRFYTVKEGVRDKTRYKAMQEEKGRRIFGRESEISYIFFDDKLFSYHVFVRDREPSGLEHDMRSYLIRQYGPHFSFGGEEQPLKMIWNQKSIIVNYWFFKDVLNLSDKYAAGYGIVYRPIEEAISG